MKDLIDKHNITKAEAKQTILAVMNGGQRHSTVTWFNDFKLEINQIHQTILKLPANKALIDIITKTKNKKNYNIEGRLTNHILCQLEDNVLMACVEHLKEHHFATKNIVLCFDGFMLPKQALNPTNQFLTDLSDAVFQKLAYRLKFNCKPMDMILNLQAFQCDFDAFIGNKGCLVEDDTGGAEVLLQALEGEFFKCENHLYIKLEHNNIWTCEPTQVHNQLSLKATLLDIRKASEKGDKPFSRNFYACNQIVNKAKLLAPIDDTFSQKLFKQSINKLFFLDGVYDFTQINPQTGKYGLFRSENEDDLTPIRLNKNFPTKINNLNDQSPNNTYDQETEKRVHEVLISFLSTKETKQTFLHHIARGIAGCYEDKNWVVMCGPRNCGKGVATEAIGAAFGEYVGYLDANNLLYKKSVGSDEARAKSWLLPFRWTRLVFGNEQNPSSDGDNNTAKMNGIFLKSLASGGDLQIARGLYQEPISFTFGGRLFLCVNEIPTIVPNDACETMTLFTLTNKFVDTLEGLNQMELKFMKLKDPKIKNEVKTNAFSNALIQIILDHYLPHAVLPCDYVKNKTIEHRVEQGDDYLLFKTNFDLTHLEHDQLSTAELRKYLNFLESNLTDKRVKQILIDQFGLKTDNNILYDGKKSRGYIGIKVKANIKRDYELSKNHLANDS